MIKQLSQELLTTLKLPELQLVLGGIPQTDQTKFIPTADALVARRISETEKSFIADNNQWQNGKIYNQWNTDVFNNYYVYNPSNRIVYLCTDNKLNNRKDEESSISTVVPSDVTPGVFKTEDGYSWCPLFKVDLTQIDFISNTDLPLPKLEPPENYLTLTEKYSDLCPSGSTSFGCCCLYNKENEVNDITGVTYLAGSLTNEIIFSECFECQKLAEETDKDVLFLAGYTAGDISSNVGPNPLCPQTKTIKSFKDQLTEEQYTLTPGSSREYALYLLNNFENELGIMAARIDLSELTEAQKTISSSTQFPSVNIVDPTGSGATARLLTESIGPDTYVVNGIELLTSGSGYSELIDWSTGNTFIDSKIELIRFPKDFYNNPIQLVPEKRLRIKLEVPSYQIKENVETENITKIAVMVDPKDFDSGAPVKGTGVSKTIRNLQTEVIAVTGATFTVSP